ncbi:hypothetical protein MXB_15, partial [Myxobolus squamalis]
MAVLTEKIEKPKNPKKVACINRVKSLAEDYNSIILFNCDNVASNQLKKIRNLL